MKRVFGVVFLMCATISQMAFAETVTCEKVTYKKSNQNEIYLEHKSAKVNLESGTINISSGSDFPVRVLVSEENVFDFSAPAIIYKRSNCASVEVTKSAGSVFNYNCLDTSGDFRLFARLKVNESNNVNTQIDGRLLITYSSIFNGPSSQSKQVYKLSRCK